MGLTVVDAFTDRPFAGNPAAVAVVEEFLTEARMQAIAREMNLSETAFAVARGDGTHDLRWFTPVVEVDLCGHATLATAHVLGGTAVFHTRSGMLTCERRGEWIEMDFPAWTPTEQPLPFLPRGIAAAGRRAFIVTARAGPGAGADVVSRVFAPNAGVPEDPVTGSAHCALAPPRADS